MIKFFSSKIVSFGKDEDGITMVEYGIVVALVAAACISVVVPTGIKTSFAFKSLIKYMSLYNV